MPFHDMNLTINSNHSFSTLDKQNLAKVAKKYGLADHNLEFKNGKWNLKAQGNFGQVQKFLTEAQTSLGGLDPNAKFGKAKYTQVVPAANPVGNSGAPSGAQNQTTVSGQINNNQTANNLTTNQVTDLPTVRAASELSATAAQPKQAFEGNPSHTGLSGTALLNQIQKELDTPEKYSADTMNGNQTESTNENEFSINDLLNGSRNE